MILFLGIAFIVLGIVMLVKYMVGKSRPKVDARVLGLLKEAPQGQFIELPHALVEYTYQNTKYTTKVLLASKPKSGDTIRISVKPEAPTKAREYYPKKEVLAVIVLNVLGVVLIAASFVLTDMLS